MEGFHRRSRWGSRSWCQGSGQNLVTLTRVRLTVQSKLVEVGFGGLVQLFLKISSDGMGKLFDPEHLLETGQ